MNAWKNTWQRKDRRDWRSPPCLDDAEAAESHGGSRGGQRGGGGGDASDESLAAGGRGVRRGGGAHGSHGGAGGRLGGFLLHALLHEGSGLGGDAVVGGFFLVFSIKEDCQILPVGVIG